MKLKSLLASSLLLACLAATAAARQKADEFRRKGDAFSGPVKSARIEQADYGRVGGAPVESARRLISFITYAPDGKSREFVDYAPDGSVQNRYTHVYDDAGNEVEMSRFDAAGGLKMRRVQIPEAGERRP